MIKPAYHQPIDRATYDATLAFFDNLLKLLHPFMPFITEELWQNLYERKDGESIMIADKHVNDTLTTRKRDVNDTVLDAINVLKEVVSGVRNIRASKNIPQKEVLTLISPIELNPLVAKLANVEVTKGEKPANASTFIVGTTEFAIPMDKFINVDEELKKLEADLAHQQGFLRGVMAKLSNERFVANAKPEIVELERKKKADAESRIASLEEAIKALKS